MEFSKVAIALDIWTDSVKNYHHLGATANYLIEDKDTGKLTLVSRTLKLWPLDSMIPKDSSVVNDVINEVLAEYDLIERKDELIFLTDRGGNLVNALDGYDRRSCINHFLNNIAKTAITSCENVKSMKLRINRLVKYLKISGRKHELTGSLVSFGETRWNSFYMVLKSFVEIFDEIQGIIPRSKTVMLNRFNSLNKEKLIQIKDFLEPFYSITKELEYDKEVTATKILPCYELLVEHLNSSNDDDIPEVKAMRKSALDYFNKDANDVFPKYYKYWTFFDPRCRNMNAFKTVIASEVLRGIRVFAESHFDDDVIDDVINNNLTSHSESGGPSIFCQFQDFSAEHSTKSIASEFELYLVMPFDKNESILDFWSKQKKSLPKLYKFFCSFAAIPATSASVERMFSDCSNTVTPQRNRLSNETIDWLAFLHKNSKK